MPTVESQSVSRRTPATSGCFILVSIAAVALGVASSEIYYSGSVHKAEFVRRQQERRLEAVADVKAGRSQVLIYDVEMIEMLADDPQCIANVTSVVFVMADLSDAKFYRLKELRNVEEIGFYDCRNADNVLSVAKEMDSVQELFFEVTKISEQSIQSLAGFPNLKKVHFEQIVPDETIAKLNTLLPNANVETPYPASKER
jgi:hypothetical protein